MSQRICLCFLIESFVVMIAAIYLFLNIVFNTPRSSYRLVSLDLCSIVSKVMLG